jgi:hypothetical protein
VCDARVCLDLRGRGEFCYHVVEYLGVGACVIGRELATEMPAPREPGVHLVRILRSLTVCLMNVSGSSATSACARLSAEPPRPTFDRSLALEQLGALRQHSLAHTSGLTRHLRWAFPCRCSPSTRVETPARLVVSLAGRLRPSEIGAPAMASRPESRDTDARPHAPARSRAAEQKSAEPGSPQWALPSSPRRAADRSDVGGRGTHPRRLLIDQALLDGVDPSLGVPR